MSVFLIVFFLLTIYKIEIKESISEEAFDKENSNGIKGIFLLLVFLSHVVGYYKFNSPIDLTYMVFRSFLGQCIVTIFLFFSGYGIMESIKKDNSYIDTLISKRILKVLLNFDIAVTLFLLLRLALNHEVELKQYLLSLVAWAGIGNSNWYIFCILFCYLFTYIAFKIFDKNYFKAISTVIILSIVYMIIVKLFKPYWWYDTILVYSIGIMFSVFKEQIILYFSNCKRYFVTLLLSIISLPIVHIYIHLSIGIRTFFETLFTIAIVLLIMHVNINNKFLCYLGKNLFGLYILQRLPMLFFKDIGLFTDKYIFIIVCFITTLIINELFKKLLIKVDYLIE